MTQHLVTHNKILLIKGGFLGTKCTKIACVLSTHCGNYDAHLDLLVDWERGYLNAIPLPLNTFRGFNTFRDLDVRQHYLLITKTAAISYARHTSWCLGNITTENSDTHTHTRLTALCPGLPESKYSGSGISWAVCSLHLAPDR